MHYLYQIEVLKCTPESLNSRNSKAYQNLGAALYSSGKRDEAHKAWLAAVAINPQDIGSLNNLVKYYILENELDKAREFIERIEKFGGRVDPQVVNYFKNKIGTSTGSQRSRLDGYEK